MRRWIFAALVLANFGMFLWGIQYVEPQRINDAAGVRL